MECGRVLQFGPWNIGDLEQSEFFALIDVRRAGQRQLQQNRGPCPARAQRPVLHVTAAIAQQPILGDLVVAAGRNLRQAISAGMAGHVVVAHHPCGGRTGFARGGQPAGDRAAHPLRGPIRLGKFEVEYLPELIGARIQVLPRRIDPRFGHGEPRRVVFVEHSAPLAVDVVQFVAVVHRVAAVGGEHVILQRPIVEVVAVHVLDQTLRGVDAEPIHAAIGPEPDRVEIIASDLLVVPVQIGLTHGPHVQIPLAILHALPGRASEPAGPVGRRQFSVRAAPVAKDVPIACGRSARGVQRLLEPGMPAGGVVGHEIDDHADMPVVRGGDHTGEILHGAQQGVDVAVVGHVVPAVLQRRRVKRAEPYRVHAQCGQMIHAFGDTANVADAVAGRILE